jgi:hypothetical protein
MFIEIDQQLSQQNLEPNFQLPECSIDLPKESEIEAMLSNTRHKFGLKPLEVQIESIENLFDETNIIQGALEIKLESEAGDYEVTEHYSEDQNFSDSSTDDEDEEEEEEEDDSEIEELSDSQLRKHEDSLHLKDESSDSGQEDRKSRRRKYRKSSDEKLFE